MGRKKIEIDPKEVEKAAAEGLVEYQIAEALGICQDTFTKRKQEEPEIAEALKRGKGAGTDREHGLQVCAESRDGSSVSDLAYLLAQGAGRVEGTAAA